MQPEKYYSVYNPDGERILLTPNILKARGFASVRGLKAESDKGVKKPQHISLVPDEKLLEKAVKDLGLAPRTISTGQELSGSGKKLDEYERKKFASLPAATELFGIVRDQINKEKRTDVLISLKDLRMTDKGKIHKVGSQYAYPMEESAYQRLLPLCRVFPSASKMFGLMDWDMISSIFNYQMKRWGEVEEFGLQKPIKLGLREIGGKRSIYRFVSTQYAAWGGDSVLESFIDSIKGTEGCKGEISYNPVTTMVHATAMWSADHSLQNGDVFKAGLHLRTGDKRNSGVSCEVIAERLLCANRQMVATDKSGMFYHIHKGEADKLKGLFCESVGTRNESFSSFLECWGKLQQMPLCEYVLWGKTFKSVEDAMEFGVQEKLISTTCANSVLVDALIGAFSAEKGDSLADLINSITRAAHEGPFSDSQRYDLERTGGKLARELVLIPARPIEA